MRGWGQNMATISPAEAAIVKRKRRASGWALMSNGLLLAIKVVVGAATGSVAVLAEIVNSAADLTGSMIVFWSVQVSDEPPDRIHTYGHGKIENLSGILTAALILSGGSYCAWQAMWRLFHPERLVGLPWAVAAMAFSALLNAVVSAHLLKTGRDTESPALTADGQHLRTDVLTSLAVVVGLALVQFTGKHRWDSFAALGVSILIVRIGYVVARDAVEMLVDRALPESERATLEAVLRANPAVRGFHRLRTRKAGSQRHADVHVLLDDNYTLVEAHSLAEELEDEMRQALPNMDAMVHPEPFVEEMRHQREQHADLQENPP
jgi:cation diffusion facilitator family transporter